MPSTPTFTTAIYSRKLASKFKGIHHSSISHRVQIFVDKACLIAVLQSEHWLRSYRNARNLRPLFLSVMFTPAIVLAVSELFSKQTTLHGTIVSAHIPLSAIRELTPNRSPSPRHPHVNLLESANTFHPGVPKQIR